MLQKTNAVIFCLSTLFLGASSHAIEVSLTQVDSYNVSYSVSQIEYSPEYQLLFLRESSSKVHVIDVANKIEIDNHFSTEQFTDMDLTGDSKYLFVADYGGERTGYGDPIRPHYVHRYDLENRTWKIAQAPKIAWKIEGVSETRVLLQEHDQHVDMTLNSFGDSMVELSRIRADYYGDFEYDPQTQRIYHGCSGSSSREIHVRRVSGDTLVDEGNTGTYGTAQGGGGTSVLSTDGYYFYYGRLQVEAMNVKNNLHTFPENIYAASDSIAFGTSKYYYTETGVELGSLGYSSSVYGVSENGKYVWAFDSVGNRIHLYEIGGSTEKRLIDMTVSGPSAVGYEDMAQFCATALYMDGSTEDVTLMCDWSIDRDIFGSVDGTGLLTTFNRPGTIEITALYTENGRTLERSASIECIPNYGQNVVETDMFSVNTAVNQIEYSPEHDLLFLRRGENAVLVVEASTRQVLEIHEATEKFTDMDLTGDSQYLFVADYGDERTGYGTPIRPHYVHRYDLDNRTWKIAQAPKIAWKIEGVSADRVLLQEHDQHVDMTLNSFGDSMVELSRIRADYYGDFEYDSETQRVYHGCSGSSSREIHVRRVSGDTLINEGNTGTYGTAQNGGGTSVLSSNGLYFYYGRLQVDAMHITTNLHTFTQTIYAASDKIAFGQTRYYDAETGEELSGLGFSSTVYGVSENGKHLWAYESEGNMLHHYTIESEDDNMPPVAVIEGEDRVVEAEGNCGATVHLDGSASTDENSTPGTNDDIVEFNWFEEFVDANQITMLPIASGQVVDVNLPLGEHTIVLVVVDSQGLEGRDQISVIVEDNQAPEFEIEVTPSMLWPVNHKLVKIEPVWQVSDNCDENPVVTLLTVDVVEDLRKISTLKNNEDSDDIQIDDDGNVYLRSERSGNSADRVYTLTYQAVDDSANTTIRTVTVTVPHDQSVH